MNGGGGRMGKFDGSLAAVAEGDDGEGRKKAGRGIWNRRCEPIAEERGE